MSIFQYRRERKIQIPSLIAIALFGAFMAFFNSHHFLSTILSTAWLSLALIFLHTIYLALKYKVIELTIGTFVKSENPIHYWLIVCLFLLAGSVFAFRGIGGFSG